jgi:hypothetical protein
MIGYIQSHDIKYWDRQIQAWLQSLVDTALDGWELEDALCMTKHDQIAGSALLESVHRRKGGLSEIRLHHLWVQMSIPSTESSSDW